MLAEYSHPLRSLGIRWSLSRGPLVIVMQAAQYGARDNIPAPRWLTSLRRLARDSLPKSLVRSGMIEIVVVLLRYPV